MQKSNSRFADYITYLFVFLGILRLGHAVFFISPRNSSEAVSHLLVSLGATHLVVGLDESVRNNAAAALHDLREKNLKIPDTSSMLTFEEVYLPTLKANFELLPSIKFNIRGSCIFLHTSGI